MRLFPVGLPLGLASLALFSACTSATEPVASTTKAQTTIVQLLPESTLATYRAMMPDVGDASLTAKLASGRAIFYDKSAIPPGYQDSMGDPVGMRPNTIEANLIDFAVPGGHAQLFRRSGTFHFPFGTGGMDRATNGGSFNFWIPPVKNGEILPVTYWTLGFSRWRWVFPVGTVIGEVLTTTLPSGERVVFEVRTRERTLSGWRNDVFRPFNTATDLAQAIKARRPGWQSDADLAELVAHLQNPGAMTARTLSTTYFPGTFDTVTGAIDELPDFGDAWLVKELLTDTAFSSAKGRVWKQASGVTVHAPSAAGLGITADHYDAGMFPVDDDSCSRCHKDAGRGIGDFHPDLIAYGELWGEDQIFSWHPFEAANFRNADGSVNNFNDNNRAVRSVFQSSGLVQPFDPARHSEDDYKQLSYAWTFHPI